MMSDSIEGDWRMLIEEEPIGPDNRVYTFRDGLVLDEAGHERGSYNSHEAGHHRITIGEVACEVRSVGGGTAQTLTGSTLFGDWSEPVVFSRVRYQIRPPYGGFEPSAMCNRTPLQHDVETIFGAARWLVDKLRDNQFDPVGLQPGDVRMSSAKSTATAVSTLRNGNC